MINLINKTASFRKSGPGRVHRQGNSRKQTAMKYPGTHRAVKEKK